MIKYMFGKLKKPPMAEYITVVSGLPRSGTSMMMQMLSAGGMPILTDHIRQQDDHNPRGYYEYEPVKRLHKGENRWLAEAGGKAVKIISPLLVYLPPDYRYKVIFMQRDLHEVIESQRVMRGDHDSFSAETLAQEYTQHLAFITRWLSEQAHSETLYVAYREALQHPAVCARQINRFIGGSLDVSRMQCAIDPTLYRQRFSHQML